MATSNFYTLLACLAVAFLLSAVFQAQADGGFCSQTGDCLSGTSAKDLAGAAVDSRANCTSGVCTGCGVNFGSHCQCRAASGSACNATSGVACTLQWNITNPSAPPTVNPAGVCHDCPSNCTGNGVCGRDFTCTCRRGWSGLDCSVAFDLSNLINTGVYNNGTVLPDGVKDPHWNVTSGPNISSEINATVVAPASFWEFGPVSNPGFGNSANSTAIKSKWISPLTNQLSNNSNNTSNTTAPDVAAGIYNYTNRIDLSGFYTNVTAIGVLVASDDQVVRMQLNGQDLLLPQVTKPYSFSHIYELWGWLNGTNTLSISVLNLNPGPSPSGLRVEAEIVRRTTICDSDSECLGLSLGATDTAGKVLEGGFCGTASNNSTSTNLGKTCQCTTRTTPTQQTGAIGSHCQCIKDPRCGQQYGVFSWNTGSFLGCAAANSPACL